jgi:hypothetical protein
MRAPPASALGALLAAAPLLAQAPQEPLAIPRTDAAITMDGSLSDPGWKGAAVIDRFWETQPADNTPPKVRTTAYLTYDGRFFYIGIRCDDPSPRAIRAPYVDRDQVIGTDDNIAVFLDTRNDRRSALELRVNPRGIQGDGVYNDGATRDELREDFSPDFFYDTAAQVTAEGWTAEMRIPFSSLRYGDADPQTWGILIWRNYPRDFRYAIHSSPIPRGSNCLVCHVRPITGLAGLPSGSHLVAAPYVTGTEEGRPSDGSDLRSRFVNRPAEGDAGADVKWIPNPDTVLDATLNPDFSQIESDVPQIGVNERFALFFPEKRPFFLESVDLLATPIQAVYTRTITSPRWGARATGKLGNSAYTVLVTEDRGGGSVILPGPAFSNFAPQDFGSYVAIARVRHDVGRSFAGLLVTDFLWRPSEADQVIGQFLYADTRTPDRPELSTEWTGEKLRGGALDLIWNHSLQTLFWTVEYRDVGDGFRADTGFVPQVGYREGSAQAGPRFFPNGLFNFLQPRVGEDYVEDRDGRLVFRRIFPGVDFNGMRNLVGFVGANLDSVRVGGAILDANYAAFFVQFDPSRRFTRIGLQGFVGEQIDFDNGRVGRGADLVLNATARPTDHLELQVNAGRRWLDLSGGSRLFTAEFERLKATYTFTARAFLRLIGQRERVERDPALYTFAVDRKEGSFIGSALLSYKLNWQTVAFLGYGDTRVLVPEANGGIDRNRYEYLRASRQFFLKLSYAFQR